MPYTYTHGSGTENDPYQIWDANDLDGIRDHLSSYFIQMADIDMSAWGNFNPIGRVNDSTANDFTGTYKFNNFDILDLFIDYPTSYDVALFSRLEGAQIFDVSIINPTVRGAVRVASLAGDVAGFSKAANIKRGKAINVHVSGHYILGGLVGSFGWNAYWEESYSTGLVKHIDSGGAFANGIVGGFVGYVDAWSNDWTYKFKNCYSRCSVDVETQGVNHIGGFVGYAYNDESSESYIENCYSAGNMEADSFEGKYEGGFCGTDSESPDDVNIINCYYDSGLSGMSDTGKGEPRATAEMTYPYSDPDNVYIDWDFYGEVEKPVWQHDQDGLKYNAEDVFWSEEESNIIKGPINDGYPHFIKAPQLKYRYMKAIRGGTVTPIS